MNIFLRTISIFSYLSSKSTIFHGSYPPIRIHLKLVRDRSILYAHLYSNITEKDTSTQFKGLVDTLRFQIGTRKCNFSSITYSQFSTTKHKNMDRSFVIRNGWWWRRERRFYWIWYLAQEGNFLQEKYKNVTTDIFCCFIITKLITKQKNFNSELFCCR